MLYRKEDSMVVTNSRSGKYSNFKAKINIYNYSFKIKLYTLKLHI